MSENVPTERLNFCDQLGSIYFECLLAILQYVQDLCKVFWFDPTAEFFLRSRITNDIAQGAIIA